VRGPEADNVNPDELDSYCRPLIGLQLSSVEKRDHSWIFSFEADTTVRTESLWRLMSEARIVVTSEDDGHRFGLPEPVEAAAISASTGDLTIEFSGRVQLELLQTSCGYESWSLSAQGSETICTGGGDLAIVPKQ